MLYNLQNDLRELATPERAAKNSYFFKNGKNQYGEGDVFIGVSNPQVRKTVKAYYEMPLEELQDLLEMSSPRDWKTTKWWHYCRTDQRQKTIETTKWWHYCRNNKNMAAGTYSQVYIQVVFKRQAKPDAESMAKRASPIHFGYYHRKRT